MMILLASIALLAGPLSVSAGLSDWLPDILSPPQYYKLPDGFADVMVQQRDAILEHTRPHDLILLLGNEMAYVSFVLEKDERVWLLPFSGRWESGMPVFCFHELVEFADINDKSSYANHTKLVKSYCQQTFIDTFSSDWENAHRIVVVDRSLTGESPRQFLDLMKACVAFDYRPNVKHDFPYHEIVYLNIISPDEYEDLEDLWGTGIPSTYEPANAENFEFAMVSDFSKFLESSRDDKLGFDSLVHVPCPAMAIFDDLQKRTDNTLPRVVPKFEMDKWHKSGYTAMVNYWGQENLYPLIAELQSFKK
ncbi:MAG: hypothetical protein SGCHY_002609 [Lobulomycetales sp.]